jgi:hypothetical protein
MAGCSLSNAVTAAFLLGIGAHVCGNHGKKISANEFEGRLAQLPPGSIAANSPNNTVIARLSAFSLRAIRVKDT